MGQRLQRLVDRKPDNGGDQQEGARVVAGKIQGKAGQFATPKQSVVQRRRTEAEKDAVLFDYW